MLTHTHEIVGSSNGAQLLKKNDYNNLGQLITKRVGGSSLTGATSWQKIDYAYNIRGWLLSINNSANNNLDLNVAENDLFAFKINYNTIQTTSLANGQGTYIGKELYNGNISETYWRTKSDNVLRKYSNEYDSLNRMNNAVYQKPDAAMPVPNYYNETVTYDKNGNISTMVRNGDNDVAAPSIVIDNLTYTYEPNTNKLLSVTDATPAATSGFRDQVTDNLSNNSNGNINDYGYDLNGNMTSDDNKEITSIKYNHLNLPVEINFTGASRKINYLYNAAGGKLRKVVTNGGVVTTTDYLNGFQYNAAVLVFFPHAEGYVSNTVVNGNNQYRYVFNYTDHPNWCSSVTSTYLN